MKRPKAKSLFSVPDPLSWYPLESGFALECFNVSARLQPRGAVWEMLVVVSGQRYTGQRPTLEDAFKAADRLIYEKAKDVWLQSKCTAAIAPWVGTLEDL